VAWGVGALLGLVAVAVVAAEIAGWPFLAGPMQSFLAKALNRPVRFDGSRAVASPAGDPAEGASADASTSAPAATDERRAGGVKVKLFGRIEVQARRLEIGAPAWSRGLPMLVADDARLVLRYGDLWRAYRGQTLRVRGLEAARLALGLERLADGRASWQFGPPKPRDEAAEPVRLPVFEQVSVGDGRLRLRDALTEADVDARFSLVDGDGLAMPAGAAASASAPASRPTSGPTPGPQAQRGLRAQATGHYRRLPLQASLQTVGVLPWVAEDGSGPGVPLRVEATVGRARFQFDGSVRDAQNLGGLGGSFRLDGPSLAAVGDVLGVTLPTTAAFTTRGVVVKQGEVWSTRVDSARIGQSSLQASLRYDPTRPTPLLSGRVTGPRLLLADLGPAIGTTPARAADGSVLEPVAARPGRVLPDREFDLPSLRAMDANVLFDLAELDLGTERLRPLQPMRARLVLDGGVLELREIDARTADGRLAGEVRLDGRDSVAVWRTDLRWSQVRIEQWLQLDRGAGKPPYLSGRLDGRARLEGRGRSTAQILASLNGDLRGRLRDGSLSHLIVEAAGLDLAQAIGVFVRGDDPLPLDCALADLKVERGTATPRVMVVDTRDSVVWIEGGVSLADERLDLRARVSPRDFSPLALRTPIQVRGTLSAPEVSLQKGPLVRKLGLAGALALVNPFAAVLPLLDFGSDELPATGDSAARAGGCRALAQAVSARRAEKAGEAPAGAPAAAPATRKPASPSTPRS
jgi:uncharacterized protein involved in outer membrane biogenesis